MHKLKDALMTGLATTGAIFLILIFISYFDKSSELIIENRIYFLIFFFVYTLFIFLISRKSK